MSAYGDPSDGHILGDTKVEIEHDIVTSIKVEPGVLDEYNVQHQEADVMEVKMKNYIKDEPGTFSSDTVIKNEYDFSESEPKYTKKEEYIASDGGISSSNNNIETLIIYGNCAGPSSSYELKSADVDLGTLKRDESKDIGSKLTDTEEDSIEEGPRITENHDMQPHAHTIHRSKHVEKFKAFGCTKCQKEFSSKFGLDYHIVTRHSNNVEVMKSVTNKIHRCKHCRYITVQASYLTQHMRKHDEKLTTTFNCTKCRKGFSCKSSLDGHIVTQHNNDDEMMRSVTYKIHRCKYCTYLTIQTSHLVQHMRKHGERLDTTFDCMKCKKEFSSRFGLDNHIVTQHSNDDEVMKSVANKIHRCKYCRYITVQASYLTQHMKRHEENT